MTDEHGNGVEVKALESLEIKDESTGEVELIFATLNVVDRDRDVIAKGAIPEGVTVKMSSYGHDIVTTGAAPVGKGPTFIRGDKVGARIKMFMTTQRGKEALAVIKEMGEDQEWSFGFKVLEEEPATKEWSAKGAERILTKLSAFEVSPVLIGAGIGTRTLAAKDAAYQARKAAEEAEAAAKEAEAAAAVAVTATEEEAAKKAAEELAVKEAAEAEARRLQAEEQERLQAEINAEVERFQRTRQKFGL